MSPEAPALVQLEPPPRWQRCLIPFDDPGELATFLVRGTRGDPAGWADGSRLIDRHGHVFRLTSRGVAYTCELIASINGAELRAIMRSNLRSLGHPITEYEEITQPLLVPDLVAATVQYALELPSMHPALRGLGCLAIVAACALAVAVPIGLILWLVR
jgi:hypothetical protein